MKLKQFIFAFMAMLLCFSVSVNAQNVAKVGDTEYAKIDDAIANCTNGTTLTLLANLNLSEILTINKAITFDGNGKTLTSSAGRAINVSGAEANGVKIQNLTINASGERAINVINGATNVIVENVTATAANYTVNLAGSATNAVVTVKNSNLTGLNVVNVAAAGAKVTVTGGTLVCNDQTDVESYAALFLNENAKEATITATGVTFDIKGDSKKAHNAAADGTITIDGNTEDVEVAVAYISYGDNTYTFNSIEDAVAKAEDGETITLIRDVTIAEKIVINKSITLDGNDKSLTYTGTDRAIDVPANADATVNVTIENLTVDCTASYCQRGINYNDDGALTLNKVTVKGTNVTYALNLPGSSDNAQVTITNSDLSGNIALNVWGENSTINAKNTTFTAVDNNTVEGYAAVKLNNDGTTSAEGSVITITGGKIDVTGSACTDTEATSNGTSTGKINISDSTVVNGKNAEMVAVIRYADGNSYSFMTIEDAIEFAKAGETVTLLRDVTTSEILVLDKAITFDGNGKTLTSTAGRAINVSGADGVTIKNLTINASGERAINVIQNATNVTIDNVTATAKNYTVNVATSAPAAVVAISNSTLNGLCTVNVSAAGSNVTVDKSTVNCNDNNTTAGESYAALCLNKEAVGGSIVATNTTVNVAEGSDSTKGRNGAENGTVTINGSTEGVTVMVAVITYSGSNYYHAFATIEDAIEFAKAGDVITLIRDVTTSEIIVLDKAITFDGNGKTLTSTATGTTARAINVSGAEGVTIKNLTINASGERAINVIQNATNVTIENVTATAANYTVNVAASAPNAVVAIKNSTLNGLCTVNVAAAGANVTVDNSTVNCNDNNTTAGESYAALCLNKAAVGASIVATNTTVNVTEGSDSEKGRNGAENGTVTINGSTEGVTVTVAVITYPGSDNYHGFTSLADAIEFAKAGDTITLIRDITASAQININKNVTIDGNGKKLTVNAARGFQITGGTVAISNLTIDMPNAAEGNRGVNLYNGDSNAALDVTLNNVTINGGKAYAVNIGGGKDNKLTIKNSTLTGYAAINVHTSSVNHTIVVDGSTLNGKNHNNNYSFGTVVIDGTNAHSLTITNTTITTENLEGVTSKYEKVIVGANCTLNWDGEAAVRNILADSKGGKLYYTDLQTAINDAAEVSGTVQILGNITTTKSVVVPANKKVTLDLNGKKVTSTAKKAFEVHADATIKNGAIEAVQRCVDTRKAVKLTLTGVELVAKSTTYGNPQPLTIGGSDNGTEVTMENVEINAGTAGYGIITFVETELTATNSTIGGYNALYVKPGSDNSVFNFVDSDLSGSTVGNDVEGNSFSVIAVRANNVTVNVDVASTVTAAGNYSYAISFKSKSDIDTPATGSSVTVAGTITGNILADLNGNTVKVKAEYADELASAGYATIEAENGLVAAIKAVAKIGETYYATLAEAFAVAQDGETITVLQDIEVSETIVNTKKVTLNLNGKTISQEKECTASYEMINNKGNLTITGDGKLSFKDTSAGDPNFGWGSYTVRNEGTLVVENGTIEHLGAQTFATHMICAIFQYSGSTTINGGTISTPNYRSARLWKGDMTINGGTFDGQLWVQAVDNTAKLTINGGTFEPNGGDASAVFVTNNQYDVQFAVTDGTFNGKVGCSDATKLAGAITGGKFNKDAKDGTNEALLATGFIFGEAGTDGYYTVVDDPSTLYIANLNDLKAFRDAVNTGANYYEGVNVYLAADIDMAGENWVGIGSMNAEHGFMGNFDGKNFKIMNLTITNPALDSDGYAYAGLFALTEGTDKDKQNVVKNLTIENVTITTTGHIAAAAVAYPYYTIIDNVKVCGDIKIQGGNYTAGVLAYTRRCVNASKLSIVGNDGSFVKGNQTVGGVISDIQMNGGLTAVYNNFSAEGLTISGAKQVGGISGIIATQTLDGASVKNVALSCSDARVGVVSGCLGGTSTISNVTYENVTGATALIGASYKDAKAVAAKIGDTYYATLEDALAAESNEAVELLVPYVVAKGETVTLDLNDKTVTGTPSEAKAYAVITNYGTLTISNGSVICKHTLAGSTGYAVNTITNCGTLTIEDATIENKSTAQYQIGYAIDNNSTSADAVVNIKGGKVIASGSSYYDGIRQFCNSQTKENSVVVSGGEVSTIWMQNPSDGATKNTKDVKGSIAISGGKVGVLSLEPSANFEAAVTGGHFGEISYFQTAEGRDLKGFITGGTFDKLIDETFLAMGYKLTGDAAPYTVAYTGEVTELVLVDGEVTEFVNEKEITIGTLTYKRSNIKNTWTPFYVPFAVPVSALADKFDVAYINDVRRTDSDDDGELDKFSMEIIYIHGGNANGSSKTLKANYPYFIRSKSGVAEMEITLTDATLYAAKENVYDCTTMTEKFEIKGNYHQIPSDKFGENDYVVGGGVWGNITAGYPLNPFRFYMTKSSRYEDEPAAPMQSMRIIVCGEEDENGATIIYDVVEDSLNGNGNDFIYDLQGRRVSEPKKGGIYIKNGKKILF